jgi:hypothetical protein
MVSREKQLSVTNEEISYMTTLKVYKYVWLCITWVSKFSTKVNKKNCGSILWCKKKKDVVL